MSQSGMLKVADSVLPPDVPTSFVTNSGTAVPALNVLNVLGTSVAAGSTPFASSGAGNTVTYNIQRSQAIAATDSTKVGVAAFDSASFAVDASGFVTLIGASAAIEKINLQTGTSPIVPTSGAITFNGAVVAAGGNPVRTDGTGPNTMALEVQISQALASADATKIGLSNYNSAFFTVGATGFVGGTTITGTSGGALSPTLANFNLLGGTSVAGTTPVAVTGAVSTLTVNVQTSQALAAADATKIGLCNFDSTSFAVAATGFVTLSTTGAGKTITGDSGGALSPTANNWNILGLSGSKTSGSGSTLTIKSPPFSQVGSSATSSLNTGEFVTAAVTRTLPASAGLADGDLFIYVCTTAGALVIQSVTAQKIRIGTLISAAAGTATSTAIGDSLTLRFNATDGFFYAVSSIGTWLVA